MAILKIKQLYFHYQNDIPLLNGVDLTLHKGELITILGANGTGKSTLLNCIAGLLKPNCGEKQLVNLARILVQQPQLILFDEPTSALDYGNVFKTLSLIKSLSQQQFSIIMTTHNPDHPMLLSEALPNSKVAILTKSGKLHCGLPAEILTEEHLRALYQTDLRLIEVPELQRKICAITHI